MALGSRCLTWNELCPPFSIGLRAPDRRAPNQTIGYGAALDSNLAELRRIPRPKFVECVASLAPARRESQWETGFPSLPHSSIFPGVTPMRFRTHPMVAAIGVLSVSILASAALAQRPVPPASHAPAQSARKVPAPPPPVQAPMTRDTQGRSAHPVQAPKSPAPDARQGKDRIPRDQLYFATSAEGAPQVRGRTYKAEFTADAASYTP